MKEYYLRGIPDKLYEDAQVKAIRAHRKLRAILIELLKLWVSGKVNIKETK